MKSTDDNFLPLCYKQVREPKQSHLVVAIAKDCNCGEFLPVYEKFPINATYVNNQVETQNCNCGEFMPLHGEAFFVSNKAKAKEDDNFLPNITL